MLQVTKLPSGLTVASYTIKRKSASLAVSIGAGWRYETESESGIGHFLEHVLFDGTKSYPGEELLLDSISDVGGFFDGTTSREWTTFHLEVLNENLNQALKTVSEQLQLSLLNPSDVEREKSIVLHEIHRMRDNPSRYIYYILNEVMWPNQTFAALSELDEATLPTLSRQKIIEYLDKYYLANNCVVCVAGDVDHEEWVSKVSQAFSKLPTKDPVSFAPAKNIVKTAVKSVARDSKQTNVLWGYFAPSRHDPKTFVARVLASITERRLRDKLRTELGLTYHPEADYESLQDTGKFVLGSNFPPGNILKASQAVGEVIRELKENEIPKNELKRAQAKLKSSITFLAEDPLRLAEAYSRRILLKVEPVLIEDDLIQIQAVTSKDLLDLANDIFTEEVKVVAIGPTEDIKVIESLYGRSNQKVSN